MKKYFQTKEILSLFMHLFSTMLLLVLCGSALGYLLPDNANEITNRYTPLFISLLRPLIKPEPVEKTIFIALCLLLVPLSITVLYLSNRIFRQHNNKNTYGTSQQVWLWAACISSLALIVWSFFGKIDFFQAVFKTIIEQPYYWLLCALLAIVVAIAIVKLKVNPALCRKWWILTIFPLVATVIFNRTYYLGWVPPNIYHMEIMIYAISQAARGQLEYHLYGNYHWMLAPLFSLIKPSIFNFSVVMNIMFIAVFMIIAFIGSKLIKNYIILFLMFIFLLLMVCWFTIHQHFVDPYFQYHPLRSLWPAISLLIFYFYYKSHNKLRYYVLAALCSAISLFWNIESGIVVTVTFSFLFTIEIIDVRFRYNALKLLCVFFATLAITLIFLYAIYCWKYGELLTLEYFLRGPKVFLSGYGALPMPHEISMWMFFAGVYVVAVIVGLRGVFFGRKSLFSQSCIFLGVLGIGLFSYYQCRSHVYTLTAPIWPAILLMFIFADRCLRLVKTNYYLLPLFLPPLPVIMLGVCAVFVFFLNAKFIFNGTIMQLSFISVSDNESQYQQRIDFIRRCAGKRRQVNIIGSGQGIYYAESGLIAGIKSFNRGEVYTISEDLRITSMLQKSYCPLFVTPGEGTYTDLQSKGY